MKKSLAIGAVLVLIAFAAMWSCTRPSLMPAEHMLDAPQAPGNAMSQPPPPATWPQANWNSTVAPTFTTSSGSEQERVIKGLLTLVDLYEKRVKELEVRVKELEAKTTP